MKSATFSVHVNKEDVSSFAYTAKTFSDNACSSTTPFNVLFFLFSLFINKDQFKDIAVDDCISFLVPPHLVVIPFGFWQNDFFASIKLPPNHPLYSVVQRVKASDCKQYYCWEGILMNALLTLALYILLPLFPWVERVMSTSAPRMTLS